MHSNSHKREEEKEKEKEKERDVRNRERKGKSLNKKCEQRTTRKTSIPEDDRTDTSELVVKISLVRLC